MSGLPDLPNTSAPNFLQRLREVVQTLLGRQGDTQDRAVTVNDLLDAGMIAGMAGDGSLAPSTDIFQPLYVADSTPPPAPTGLVVTGGIARIVIQTDPPAFTMGHGYLRTLIYGTTYSGTGPLPTYTEGVTPLLTEIVGAVGDMTSDPATEWHIWAKWETVDGVRSAIAGGTTGVSATTGQDVSTLLDALTTAANDPAAPYNTFAVRADLFYVASPAIAVSAPIFEVLTAPTVINGEAVPAGVYMRDAFVKNGTIVTAKIGDAMITDAKVVSMAVSKLTAGSIAVGEYIQSTGYVAGASGWRINGNGVAEFSGVTVRGTIVASAGSIGSSVIGANFIQSSNYVAGTTGWRMEDAGTGFFHSGLNGGAFTSFAWPAVGGGYHLSQSGLLLGNANTGKYFEVTGAGDVIAPHFTIIGGVATFSGALSAASGTFAGSLSAAGGTFAGNLSAAGGSFSGVLTAGAVNAVDTINIAGQAVTIPVGAYTDAALSTSAGGTAVQTLPAFTSKGGLIIVNFGCVIEVVAAGGSWSGSFALLRNGATIYGSPSITVNNTDTVFSLPPIADAPGAGVTVTYQLVAHGSGIVSARGMSALETVR